MKPYGSWKTPISAEKVASMKVGLSEIRIDGDYVYWLETRPSENGRTVLVRLGRQGTREDLTPEGFNVRSRVHEYGGGSYVVDGGTIFFTNFEDQRIYKLIPGKQPRPITPEGNYRYADFSFDEKRRLIWAICEDHTDENKEASNYLVSLNPDELAKHQIATRGHDFYSSPRLSPNGKKMAWVTWDHTNMPWDETQLHVASLSESGEIKNSKVIAGTDSESVTQPKWGPDGALYFISDKSNWWNLYRWSGGETDRFVAQEAEIGKPQWKFGMSTYDFISTSEIIFAFTKNGRWFLAKKELENGDIEMGQVPYTQISSVRAAGNKVWFIGGGPGNPRGVRRYHWENREVETLKLSTTMDLDQGYVSTPESIEFSSGEDETVHGFFYPPCNKEFDGPKREKPPLLVISHGGPTSATGDSFSYEIQFWTTRGFSVLDINYRGSTGFGREYREELKGEWGLVDVEDCVNGALQLVEEERVDRDKLVIRGGSAGGYTTLTALTFKEVFDAGASYYGVSDPAALARDTHKFESRYLDSLIGPYPEKEDIYDARSPLKHADRVSCPVIFFQGTEDRVVPPNQAERMYDSIKERGIPTSYLTFEGEQHGFRKEESIKQAFEAELYFYSKIFDFTPGGEVEEIDIANLD
ncbi:MAG: S9 family peptidase [Candidatus Bipolaricaulota bacterium]